MAIFHLSAKIIGRSTGRSSVAAAAYRSGDTIYNEYDGITHDYTKKRGVEFSTILLPKNAPAAYQDRGTLWNSVERIERGQKAQLAREIEVALPGELDRETQVQLLRDYVQRNFVDKGMCADINLHDKGDGNPHAHVMLTLRPIDENGEWQPKKRKEYILDSQGNKQYNPKTKTYKCRTVTTTDWNSLENASKWREQWAAACNRQLIERGHSPIDHRSHEARGLEELPTIHLGTAAHQLERRGIATERGDYNREIQLLNQEIEKLKAQRESITRSTTPQEAAADLRDKRGLYFEATQKAHAQQQKNRQLQQRKREIAGAKKNIAQDFRAIEQRAGAIEEMEARLADMPSKGIFAKKKPPEAEQLERQIAQYRKSHAQAVAAFREKYETAPEASNVKQYIDRAGLQLEKLSTLEQQQPDLAGLFEDKKTAEMNYKTAKVLADLRPDREQIEAHMRQGPAQGQGITEYLQQSKQAQLLDQITPEERQQIAAQLPEHEARQVLESIERERAVQQQTRDNGGHHHAMEL